MSLATEPLPYSAEDVRRRARERLQLETFGLGDDQPDWGDHVLAPDLQPAGQQARRPAAVLVPIIAHPDETTVLLTRRASHLRQHSGQIAFPGGKIDASDRSPLHAALREAQEEIGLGADHIEPLGFLDPYTTGTGYRIYPLVTIVRPPFDLQINRAEVDDVFEVPLHFLMQPENHRLEEREHNGIARRFYAMPFRDRYIWGATAGMLRNLYVRLYGE